MNHAACCKTYRCNNVHPTHAGEWQLIGAACITSLLLVSSVHAQDAVATSVPAAVSSAVIALAQASSAPATDDHQPQKSQKTKKTKKKSKGDDAEKKPKAPKHPSWSPLPGVRIDFKGRVESELRAAPPATGFQGSEIDWQDRRFGIEGTAFKRITFEVSRELGQDFEAAQGLSEKTAWKDAYVDVRVAKALSITTGRFKLPFGREELTGETDLDFVRRSLAARVLSPGRDPGIMASGRLFDRRIGYQVGYFTRDGDNGRTSQTEGGRGGLAARVVVAPWSSVEIGVAAASSRVDDNLGLRGRTVFGDGIFFDRVYVNGQRRRMGVDMAWEKGLRSLSAEYVIVSDQRNAMGFNGEDLDDVTARAWYVAGTWALTGERKHGRLKPEHDLLRGGIGAVELSARIEELRFGSVAYPGSEFGFPTIRALSTNADYVGTFGVNWYFNHYLKLQSNLVVEAIQDAARSPAPAADGRFVSPVLLLQFRF